MVAYEAAFAPSDADAGSNFAISDADVGASDADGAASDADVTASDADAAAFVDLGSIVQLLKSLNGHFEKNPN